MTKEEVIAALVAIEQKLVGYRVGTVGDAGIMRLMMTNDGFVSAANSMLQNSTIWTPCTERMPTEADTDADGDIYVRFLFVKNILCISLAQFSVLEREMQNEFEWARIERSTAS